MKLKSVMKGFVTFALVVSLAFGIVNPLVAQAATINDVSTTKPAYGKVVGVNSTSRLNVRSEASTSSAIVASLPYNGYVMVVGQSGNFYRVQYNTSGDYGYVSKDYLEIAALKYYLIVDVGSGNLNMRSDSTTSADIVAKIPNGTYFAYVGTEDVYDPDHPWYCGVYGNVIGYVAGNYVAKREFR